jgi:hypothetical protein
MTLYIVSEDQLSEAVMRKMVVKSLSTRIKDIVPMGKKGRGYIKKRINDLNNQNTLPFFVLADLDQDECAPVLIKNWIKRPLQQNIVFRFAVREVESWLLADTEGFSHYTKLEHSLIKKEVDTPDELPDPKEKLIALIDRCKNRSLKNDIVRKENFSYKQGPGYNSRLIDYVDNYWEIERATLVSESLKKAIDALYQFRLGIIKD